MKDKSFSVKVISQAITKLFLSLGIDAEQSQSVLHALLWAEQRGISSHGLERIPAYVAQYKKGKINNQPKLKLVSLGPSAALVDADYGFAYPALDLAIKQIRNQLHNSVAELPVYVTGIKNSHHSGALGYYAEQLAGEAGLLALLCCNSPPSMAPWGGTKPLLGTNPLAFACPRAAGKPPLLIDMSLSKVARGKVMAADFAGNEIPNDWALDKHGKPTTDPAVALQGTMLPLGGVKGYLLALIVEILSAALVDSNFSYQSSSFFDDKGKAPGIGQFILAINPLKFNPRFASRIEELCAEILRQPGTRLPGEEKVLQKRSRKLAISERVRKCLKL